MGFAWTIVAMIAVLAVAWRFLVGRLPAGTARRRRLSQAGELRYRVP